MKQNITCSELENHLYHLRAIVRADADVAEDTGRPLGVTRDVARGILERLEKEGVITICRGNCGLTHYLTQCSILTINALHDGLTQQLTQDIEGIKKKDNLKKKYNKKESSENVLSIPSSGKQVTAPAKRFTPPTAEEVQQYLASNGIVARCWALIIVHAIKKQTPCKELTVSLQGVA